MRTPLLTICLSALAACPAASAPRGLAPSTVTRNAGPGYDESVSPDGRVARSDNTGKGAVMCLWAIYEAARVAGDDCAKGSDADFRTELSRAIGQVDRFIIRNSSAPITPADLDRRRAAAAAQLRAQGPVCKGAAYGMYTGLRDRGAAALRAGTDDALSIPREPVMNPCL